MRARRAPQEVGVAVGAAVGFGVGAAVGALVGTGVGTALGALVGTGVGTALGALVEEAAMLGWVLRLALMSHPRMEPVSLRTKLRRSVHQSRSDR